MAKAVIFDYGVGNLLSIKCALERVGFTVSIGVGGQDLAKAAAIILPGVGSFTPAVEKLECVKEVICGKIVEGVPLLGICLGLQLFFEESAEGSGIGLTFFKGNVVRLQGGLKIPHIGWNTLDIVKSCALFDGINDKGSYVYFVHSLYPMPVDESIVCAKTFYGTHFVSAVADNNVFGLQFHPEKSGDVGLQILRNFARVVKR
ncbi:MAG: imidazole glycerol phosphate synthase subunit HisH [Nitrososphaerota archaeon]|jgi:glutamine amidotransferase|nr:imidazole glycerol phosphate synthase subunit HisH [Nitrososphaerota archaeon]